MQTNRHTHTALTKHQKAVLKKRKRQRKIILFSFEILVLLLLMMVLFIVVKLSKIEKNELNDVNVNDDISDASQEIMEGYKTIALFGLDNRSNGDLASGRSDVIMLAAINNKTHEVKLVSVYRDSYLNIGNNTYKKCNAAYAQGGPEQAVSMLNTNLDLNISDYVTVDFNAIVECIDLLGGVEMTITDDEANLLSGYIRELNELTGNKSKTPESGGTYTLDGVQACAFARLRYGGGDDYKRTERQRTVLMAMAAKAQKSDLGTINKLINTVFGDIQTSFSNADLLALASKVFKYQIGDTTGFPFEQIAKNFGKIGDIKVGDIVVPCDLETNVTELHVFLYEDEDYIPSDTVKRISSQIITNTGFQKGDGS